jgi:hypothetical protein
MTKGRNNLIRNFIRNDIAAAIRSFETTKRVKHRGLKGAAREIFVEKLFRSLLSDDFRLGHGVITDIAGKQARETDVILYCPEVMPAHSADEAVGYFPIEACIYTIEVKSKITAAEIKDAIKKGMALAVLDSMHHSHLPSISTRPITALFAFSSDLKSDGDAEFERFRNLIERAGPDRFGVPPIRVLCVVGKGYWFSHNQTSNEWHWYKLGADQGKHGEVLGLISGIINSVRTEKFRRYNLLFGHYLLHEVPSTRLT